MPFVFLLLALMMIVIALRGTHAEAFALLRDEFVGNNSFIPWALAIFTLGGLGYLPRIKPVADAMIGLVILGMLISNKGFFAQLNDQLRHPTPVSGGKPDPPAASGAPGLPALPALPALPKPSTIFQPPGVPITTPGGNTCIPGSPLMQWLGFGRC